MKLPCDVLQNWPSTKYTQHFLADPMIDLSNLIPPVRISALSGWGTFQGYIGLLHDEGLGWENDYRIRRSVFETQSTTLLATK